MLEVTPEFLLSEPEFVINGIPKMDFSCVSDSQEVRLVDYYRNLSADGKELLWNYVETLARLNAAKKIAISHKVQLHHSQNLTFNLSILIHGSTNRFSDPLKPL